VSSIGRALARVRGWRLFRDEALLRVVLLVLCLAIISTYVSSSLGLAVGQNANPCGLKVLALATKEFTGVRVHERGAPFTVRANTLLEVLVERGSNLICVPLTGDGAGAVLSVPASNAASLRLVGLAQARVETKARTFPNITAAPVCAIAAGERVFLVARKGGWFQVVRQGDRGAAQSAGWVQARFLTLPILAVAEKSKAFDRPGGRAVESLSPGQQYPVLGVFQDRNGVAFLLVSKDGTYLWVRASQEILTGF